jgi:predicted ATP-grasp superfamily ATP-dependent carboligase
VIFNKLILLNISELQGSTQARFSRWLGIEPRMVCGAGDDGTTGGVAHRMSNDNAAEHSEPSIPAVILSGNLGDDAAKRSLNENALALTRSLGRRGVPVYRFHPNRSLIDLSSRYCTHIPCSNLYDDPEALADELVEFARSRGVRPVLFPSSDGSAQFIADHEHKLKTHFALTTPSAECISNTQNKRRLIETADAAGIPIPKTHFPTSPDELPGISEAIDYPVIVKPLYSPDWKRPEVIKAIGRAKAIQVESTVALIELSRQLLALSSEFMVQEIVPGPTENLRTFLGCVDRDGRALTGCVRKKLRQFPPGFGYCTLTESVTDPEVFELSIKLFRALGYTGIGCAEFKLDPRDGKPRLIEINTRAVRTSALAIAAGSDFPWIAYLDAITPDGVPQDLDYQVPVRWIHLRDELWAASSKIMKGELSPIDWVKGFRGKRLVVAEFARDDVVPGLLVWAQIPMRIPQRVGRSLRQLFGGAPVPAPVAVNAGDSKK